jgi:hypothetical protein
VRRAIIPFCFLVAALSGCHKSASNSSQPATLVLKNGNTLVGTVTKSDSSSITFQASNGAMSTYPISQVASVYYGPGAGAAPAAPQQSAAAPAPANPAAQNPSSPEPSAAPPDQQYTPAETFRTISRGKVIAVRTDQTINARDAAPGQTYSGVIVRDIFDTDGQVAIPRGAKATLVIREARAKGRVEGRSELALDVGAVNIDGRRYRLETSDFVEKGREGLGANRRTAKFAGGGALLGTILGAVAGGGRGAAIGAFSGAAAGAGTQSLTRGKNVRIPAETVLNFRLEASVHIREMH